MCRLVSTGKSHSHEIEIFLATAMSHAIEIKRPPKLFLLLRLLRLGLAAPGTSGRFGETIASYIKDLFSQILINPTVYVLTEFEQLIADLGENSFIAAIPIELMSLRIPLQSSEVYKRPSKRLGEIRAFFKTVPTSLRAIEPNFSRCFESPLIAREILMAISGCPQIVENPDIYLKCLSSPSAIEIDCIVPSFFEALMFRFPDRIGVFDTFVNKLISEGYSLPNAIEFVKCWARIKDSMPVWGKSLEIALELFQWNPSVQSALQFAELFAELINIHDCIHVLLRKIAQSNERFLAVVILAYKLYSKSSVEEKHRFAEYVRLLEFPFESRKKALEMIVENSTDSREAALIFGVSETSDQEKLMGLMKTYLARVNL
jgi:hypothetical protein